jgi:hypothetical protein
MPQQGIGKMPGRLRGETRAKFVVERTLTCAAEVPRKLASQGTLAGARTPRRSAQSAAPADVTEPHA